MTHNALRAALAASSILLAGAGAGQVLAQEQTIQGGSSGTASGRDVTASTYGQGQTTSGGDGTSIGVSGGGQATAVDGTATTDASAKVNDRRAMQRSTASASDDDERATSRTRTMVREGKDVRSRTVTRYKEQGAPPERTSEYTVTNPDGTTTTRTK